MKKFLLIVSISFLFCTSLFAQQIKPRFKSMNTVGGVVGVSHPDFLFQSVNGLKNKDWFAGVGIGLDEYEIKSLPLFLDVRMDFGEKKKGFIYGDLGYNFFLEDKSENFVFAGTKTSWRGGVYTDLGVGFRAVFFKKINMLFSLGHSYKAVKKTEITNICGIVPPCYEDIARYRYNYGRFSLKVGLEL